MAKARKKKRNIAAGIGTAFYVIILIALILVMAVIGLRILRQVWAYASVYDLTDPGPVIEEYISGLRETLWDDSIASTVAAMPHPVQTDEEVSTLVREMLTQDELTYQLNQTKTRGNRRVYSILCGENAFGEVVLEEDTSRNLVANVNLPDQIVGILARIGVAIQPELYPWRVTDTSYDFSGLYSGIRITAPASFRVTLNGVELGEQYIIERDIHYDVLDAYYYRYDNLPTKVTYEFNHIMGNLSPVIYDESGNVFVIDPEKDDSQFLQPVDEWTWSTLADYLDGFADAYLHYSAGTMEAMAGLNLVLPYLESGSELESKLRQVLLIGDYSHNSYYQYYGSTLNNAVSIGNGFYMAEITANASAVQPVGTVEITRTFRIIVDASGGGMVVAAIDDL